MIKAAFLPMLWAVIFQQQAYNNTAWHRVYNIILDVCLFVACSCRLVGRISYLRAFAIPQTMMVPCDKRSGSVLYHVQDCSYVLLHRVICVRLVQSYTTAIKFSGTICFRTILCDVALAFGAAAAVLLPVHGVPVPDDRHRQGAGILLPQGGLL